jgi:hypothetical protein
MYDKNSDYAEINEDPQDIVKSCNHGPGCNRRIPAQTPGKEGDAGTDNGRIEHNGQQ